jgi:hypothetical protein
MRRPATSAGSASTGSDASAPSRRTDPAVSPVAIAVCARPACASIRYCSAAAAAAPPGTIRPIAPLASCETATGNQAGRWSARRCSAQRQTQPATWVTMTASHQRGATRSRSRQPPSTSTTAGATP